MPPQWTETFDPPDFGYFCFKEGRFTNIIRHPAIVELVDGDRDENGELESDQLYMLTIWPHIRNKEIFSTKPITFEKWMRLEPITKEEFEWLMILKEM
jgi:hypothetical protein